MRLKRKLAEFSYILSAPSLFEYARIIPTSFTKENGKLPLHTLLAYLIFRSGRTLSEDIAQFFPDIFEGSPPSKQAVLKRMGVLNYDVWRQIQKLFLERIYLPMKKQTVKGYLLIAIDGTFVTLPRSDVLNHCFGQKEYNLRQGDKNISPPQAKVSIAYDVVNRVVLDFQIAHQDVSEIPLLFRHLEALENVLRGYKIIILADRYYGSAELFKYCEMKGYGYVIRAKSNFFKHYREALPPDSRDSILNVIMNKVWIKRIIRDPIREYIQKNNKLVIRLVKGHYEFDQEERTLRGRKRIKHISVDAEYFTNLDQKVFDTDEIIQLYHINRWDIETGYNTLKTQLDIEQVNSRNPIAAVNEMMAKIIFFNIENLIWKESQRQLDNTDYVVNNKTVIEKIHSIWFISAFYTGRFKSGSLNNLIRECKRIKILIRADRHYRRWGKFQLTIDNTRHRIDGRNNPPLRITKTGLTTSNH
jgi:hypothetical protein